MSFSRVAKIADTLADAAKAAKATSAFKTANMIMKGTWAIMDVGSLGMDIYMFADSLDSELNPNHDPVMKQLIKDVTTLGVQYDGLLTRTADANDKINNLLAGLTGLHNIYQDFVVKEGIAFKQLQKLEQLSNKLMKSSPTTYQWFSKKFIQDAKLQDKATDEKFKKLQDSLKVDGLSLGLSGLGVLVSGYMTVSSVKSAVKGYQDWKKRNQPAAATDPVGLPGDATRPRLPSDSDASTSSGQKNTTGFDDDMLLRPSKDAGDGSYQRSQSRSKTLSRGKSIAKGTLKVVGGLITVGGFGMNIYVLVQRQRQRDQDLATLRTMKSDYERDIPIYKGILEGCTVKDKDGKVQKDNAGNPQVDSVSMTMVAKFFFPETFPDRVKAGNDYDNQVKAFIEKLEGKDALMKGYDGVMKDYDMQVDSFLDEMDGVYSEMIQRFKDNKVNESEDAVIDRLERSQKRFQVFIKNGKDETIDSATRKAALDNMATEFTNSIAEEMNEINRALDKVIADHNALSMLEPFAKELVQDAKDDNIPTISDNKIQRKAQTVLSTLEIAQPNRTQFKTVDAIVEGLKVLISELQKKNP